MLTVFYTDLYKITTLECKTVIRNDFSRNANNENEMK